MGNSQSSSTGDIVSNSFLFNSKSKKSEGKKNQIVVVRQGTSVSSATIEDNRILNRFAEIPKFYPILRGSLNQPGARDSFDVTSKISARPILNISYRFQEHLWHCSRVVAMEQESIMCNIKNIDHAIVALVNKTTERKKLFDKFNNSLAELSDIRAHVCHLQVLLNDMTSTAQKLNEMLPESKRLPLFSVSNFKLPNVSTLNDSVGNDGQSQSINLLHIQPIDEMTVVDKSDP